jgi:chromosome segregation ATPase
MAIGSVQAALTNLGEETPRPDTAPSGPAEMDFETKRRSAQIMQEFFQETNLREKLQEQCDDLNREVDNLRSEKAKLKKQLLEAQAGIVGNGGAVNGASASANFDQAAHTTLVDEMGRKFALETKQLEEQSQKLEVEKKAAQDREAEEARKAAELQQVLDDLNDELERQGREWDAEKKLIIQQTAQIAHLTEDITTLRDEREALSRELADVKNAKEKLQTHVAELQHTQSNEIRTRDEQISGLTKTVEQLRVEMESLEQRHSEALQEAQRSLDAQSSESSTMVQELQAKVQSLQQQHTDEICLKDETIASHLKIRDELRHDLSKLQQRAAQATLELESERNAHTEALHQKVDELQKNAEEELRVMEEEVSRHLKSIDGLQEKITTLQQGETDSAKIAQELRREVGELEQSHEAALKVKTDENEELVKQLEAINDQLVADAAELEQMKEESEGLRKTITNLEQAGQQDSSQHASILARVRAELNEVKDKADSYRAELDATQDKHQQDLRTLEKDHDAKIDSLKTNLEKDASDRIKKLQATYDALVVEKHTLSKLREDEHYEHANELQVMQVELSTLKESSGSASKRLADALAKHKDIEEEKATLADAHATSQKLAASLQSRVDALEKDVASLEELQACVTSLTEEKNTAEDAHAKSQTIITDLQARHDALLEDKAATEHLQARLNALMAEKANAEDVYAKSHIIITDLQSRHNALLADKAAAEDAHARALDALKQDSDSTSKKLVNELQSKYDQLLQEKRSTDDAHAQSQSIISDLQARHDLLLQEKTEAEETYDRAIEDLKQDSQSASKQQLEELQLKYNALLSEKSSVEGASKIELEEVQTQRDELTKQLSDLKNTYAGVLAEQAAAQDSHIKALEVQGAEIEQKYASLVDALQSEVLRLREEKAAVLSSKQSAMDDIVALKNDLHAEIDALRTELETKGKFGSTDLLEKQKQYDAILVERATAENDHEAAVALLKDDLKEQHEHALSELRSQHAELKDKLATTNREHGDAIEFLKMEFKAGHSNDMQSLMQQLEALQEQHADLTEQKASMDQAHKEAISELMVGMDTNQSDAGQQLQKKYDALVAELENARTSHAIDVEAMSEDSTQQQTRHADIQSRPDKATADVDVHAEEVRLLREMVTQLESERNHAVKGTSHAENHGQDMKTLEETLRKVSLERDEALASAQEAERLKESVQALRFERDRNAKITADNNAHAEDLDRLKEALQEIEAERDEALAAAQEAEDRIEAMKGEVVKKHLARVEPLEKQNAILFDKIGRLEAIIAAGDRVARAAATLGEQRNFDTLVEEDEEEEDADNDEGVTSSAQQIVPKSNGVHNDVIGTVSETPYSLFSFYCLHHAELHR